MGKMGLVGAGSGHGLLEYGGRHRAYALSVLFLSSTLAPFRGGSIAWTCGYSCGIGGECHVVA